jgi:hypothetical protein
MPGALICDEPAGSGWLPAWAGWRDREFWVEWSHFGSHPLREPFFQDSLTQVMRRPINHLLRHRTPIDALGRRHARRPGLRPSGFVFHTSRCGSTLVAQMLAAIRGSVVLSEAPPIDAVLLAVAATAGATDEMRAHWLEWMLSALGQPRLPGDERLFVKFDAWHVRHLPLVRRVFPDVPWVFLYREPHEVLESQLRQPGAFLVPGVLDGGAGFLAAGDSVVDRVAGLLRDTCEAAHAVLPDGGGLLVNYSELPGAFEARIAAHFRLALDDADRAAVANCARHDAKSPSLPYQHRSDPATGAGKVDAARFEAIARPAYDALERARRAAAG